MTRVWRRVVGVVASAALAGVCSSGGVACGLIFVMFVPWLCLLESDGGAWPEARHPGIGRHLLLAWAMCVAYSASVFPWFGAAIGDYTGIGPATGVAILLLAAPLFQPQFLAYALVRTLSRRAGHGRVVTALAAAAAWVATEAFVPRLLGDTLGLGLQPARWWRQAADLGGAAGLTLVILLANEAVAAAVSARRGGWRALVRPLALAALVPTTLAAYGLAVLSMPAKDAATTPLRVGLVQSNLVDYEQQRHDRGAAAVMRDVLDTHFAMSYDAIEHQRADAVLWSETVYPTTFGHPKSAAGAEFDRRVLDTVAAAGRPFVFGTYDLDARGEYNAAAFVSPKDGLVGLYRKARPFPLTEYVPPWLDGPVLRRALPWAGTWRPGDGARVFPLKLADGREIPVAPLICLDDTDPSLAVAGARLGAQALLAMSNDAWFTSHPRGAALHLASAAMRSVETRLPQFRVATNGVSAVIDATGEVVASSRLGERALVVGNVAVRTPPRTLFVAAGDWLGRASAAFLAMLALRALARAWRSRAGRAGTDSPGSSRPFGAPALPADVAVLSPGWRLAAGALRALSRGGLLGLLAAVLLADGPLHSNTIAQVRVFAALVLAPEAAAWCLLRACAARASIEEGRLVLAHGRRRLSLAVTSIAGVEAWRLPLPVNGVTLRLADGSAWRHGLAHRDAPGLARALGVPLAAPAAPGRAAWLTSAYATARAERPRGWLDHPAVKFVALPFLLSIPAFRLHEHIAYGSAFGEYLTFGLGTYATSFALWWSAWIVGVALCAAALRAAIEAGTLVDLLLRPARVARDRRWLERGAHAVLYLGVPAWLVSRMLVG